MVVYANAGSLTRAIATDEINRFADQVIDKLRGQVVALLEQFAQSDWASQETLDLENTLHDRLQAFGCKAIQWLFSRLELAAVAASRLKRVESCSNCGLAPAARRCRRYRG